MRTKTPVASLSPIREKTKAVGLEIGTKRGGGINSSSLTAYRPKLRNHDPNGHGCISQRGKPGGSRTNLQKSPVHQVLISLAISSSSSCKSSSLILSASEGISVLHSSELSQHSEPVMAKHKELAHISFFLPHFPVASGEGGHYQSAPSQT